MFLKSIKLVLIMDLKKRIIQYLKTGMSQKEIASELKNIGIKPNSLSSVEKYLKALRDEYGAKTLFHLACILFVNNELDIEKKKDL